MKMVWMLVVEVKKAKRKLGVKEMLTASVMKCVYVHTDSDKRVDRKKVVRTSER